MNFHQKKCISFWKINDFMSDWCYKILSSNSLRVCKKFIKFDIHKVRISKKTRILSTKVNKSSAHFCWQSVDKCYKTQFIRSNERNCLLNNFLEWSRNKTKFFISKSSKYGELNSFKTKFIKELGNIGSETQYLYKRLFQHKIKFSHKQIQCKKKNTLADTKIYDLIVLHLFN